MKRIPQKLPGAEELQQAVENSTSTEQSVSVLCCVAGYGTHCRLQFPNCGPAASAVAVHLSPRLFPKAPNTAESGAVHCFTNAITRSMNALPAKDAAVVSIQDYVEE